MKIKKLLLVQNSTPYYELILYPSEVGQED